MPAHAVRLSCARHMPIVSHHDVTPRLEPMSTAVLAPHQKKCTPFSLQHHF
jgi:hypothetical protein